MVWSGGRFDLKQNLKQTGVWSKKSCSFPVVEFQQPSQALTGADLPSRFADPVRRHGKQNHILLPLVVPFAVIMVNVICTHVLERGLAQ
jgi:hypothetical protein